ASFRDWWGLVNKRFLPTRLLRKILGEDLDLLVRVALDMLVHDCRWPCSGFELVHRRNYVGALKARDRGNGARAVAVRTVTSGAICGEAAGCLVLGCRWTRKPKRRQTYPGSDRSLALFHCESPPDSPTSGAQPGVVGLGVGTKCSSAVSSQ